MHRSPSRQGWSDLIPRGDTAGFPTRALQGFYRRLVSAVDVPLYHWGDTDVGGFRMLKCLQEAVQGREVQPHLMEGEGGAPYSKAQLSGLARMLPINPAVVLGVRGTT